MTREEAINKIRQMSLPKETMDILEALAPELTMSEDEMMIYELQGFLSSFGSDYFGTGEWQKFEDWLEKQKEQKPEHFELKAGKWYICHRAFCARADHLTVKEGERFQCEKDGIVKGFVIKEPEKYFKECSAPEPMEKEQKQEWSDEDIINRFFLAKAVQGCTKRTLELYKRNLQQAIRTMNKHIKDITADDVRVYLAKKKIQKCSSSYLANIHRTLSSFFTWAAAEELVEKNPMTTTEELLYKLRESLVGIIEAETINSVESAVLLALDEYELIRKERSLIVYERTDEDADMLNCCISSIEEAKENRYAYKETDGDTSYDREIDWLKSLRPQQKVEWSKEDENALKYIHELIGWGYSEKFMDAQTAHDMRKWVNEHLGPDTFQNGNSHWKPSEDEVRLINTSISFLKDFANKGYENAVECIDWLKSKLNGNTCK